MLKTAKPRRDPSLKKVILYGDLGKTFGRVHWMAVGSAGEATRQALPARFPKFRAYMRERWDQPFRVIVGTEDIDEAGLDAPVGRTEVIKIIPMVAGASDGVRMIIGAVLIVAGTYFGQAWAVNIGIAMVLGGVAEMLATTPSAAPQGSDGSKDAMTWAFNNPTLTTGQGGPVPLLYGGPMRIGGHIVSAGITAETWTAGGFDSEVCLTDDGVGYGNGDSIPWMWAKAEA